MLGERDLEVLKSLKRVDLELFEGKNDFKLVFTFGENEFFTNTVLSKKLCYGDTLSDADYPVKSEGTKIEWKDEAHNITMKNVTKVNSIYTLHT
jgi:nucleosome assembly protein 1-like 1